MIGVILAASLGMQILGGIGIAALIVLGLVGTVMLFSGNQGFFGFLFSWIVADALWDAIGKVIGAIFEAISGD